MAPDAWLAAKGATEKGFSLGRFDAGYLLRFPCAIVEGEEAGTPASAGAGQDAGPVGGVLDEPQQRVPHWVDLGAPAGPLEQRVGGVGTGEVSGR